MHKETVKEFTDKMDAADVQYVLVTEDGKGAALHANANRNFIANVIEMAIATLAQRSFEHDVPVDEFSRLIHNISDAAIANAENEVAAQTETPEGTE